MPTIDPDKPATRQQRDQELFDRIAAHYMRKDQWPASRPARQHRLLQTLAATTLDSQTQPTIRILDVGCGAGHTADYLSGHYHTYTGIDYSCQLIDRANALHASESVSFATADLFTYEPPHHFDLIIMIGVLHHMVDIQEAVQACQALLTPGGCLVVNEPQPANPLLSGLRHIRARIDDTYSDEQDELRSQDIQAFFREAGLQHMTSTPQGFLSTPFAEVMLKPAVIMRPLSQLACLIDRQLSKFSLLNRLSWNTIVAGYRPHTADEGPHD